MILSFIINPTLKVMPKINNEDTRVMLQVIKKVSIKTLKQQKLAKFADKVNTI